jgi:ATP-dependent Lon protease
MKSRQNTDTKDMKTNELNIVIEEKIKYIQEIIQNTILSVQRLNKFEIFSNSEVDICINTLKDIYEKTIAMKEQNTTSNIDSIIETLQKIIDKISIIISGFGTLKIEDLLYVSFGSEFKNKKQEDDILQNKYDLLNKYAHPIGYKIISWKNSIPEKKANTYYCENKITEEPSIIECYNHLECIEIDNIKSFYGKIYGLRLIIQNEKSKKTMIITCIVDDIIPDFIQSKYIDFRKNSIFENIPNSETFDIELIKRIVQSMSLKDLFIYGNNDIYKKQIAIFSDVNSVKYNKLNITIKKFLEIDLLMQRNMLINLLTYNNEDNIQYITYLLYDLLNINSNEVDSIEQKKIYDSFPWKIKSFFKDAMKYTVKFSQDMVSKYDINKITLEQQVYLLKAPENVREKAITKLKEIKGKTDDSSTKSKQYLEGLLKIPFGIYKKEPILKVMKDINKSFINVIGKYQDKLNIHFQKKNNYTSVEMLSIIDNIKSTVDPQFLQHLKQLVQNAGNKQLNIVSQYINIQISSVTIPKLTTKQQKIEHILSFIENNQNTHYIEHIYKIHDILSGGIQYISKFPVELSDISTSIKSIGSQIENITQILDESIYGHTNAKNQILKIIGQWMTGEQTGYCFGFEGSPGVGKTSLAKKGLAYCLKDEDEVSRPFSFIALGGSCNGSTLEGHNYTYVNSTWGRIVDILMETKCMNPIIYVDELDKVSKTEHGKEIIGILTHLIDSTQNDVFQDKYFSGINLDLSKALFIFSYNDPDQIDRILLDRIHRIKFENLSITDKLVIVENHILPEINQKMGFQNTVILSKPVIEYIIETYTLEPGVRKLKEVLFDLFGEINIQILKGKQLSVPIHIQIEDLETNYLKNYIKINEKKIHEESTVGVINGLWANALGKGGIIPIEIVKAPSTTFLDLKLTGMQGDVMKESMNVAKSLAWKLTEESIKNTYQEANKSTGLHIHCPEGAVSKDGPSAGAAITTAIYSIINNLKIKNDLAITGEINLQGFVTQIGGLEMKILGGIRAGIKTFLFPHENIPDFEKIKEKYEVTKILENITFVPVKNIHEVFTHAFSQ